MMSITIERGGHKKGLVIEGCVSDTCDSFSEWLKETDVKFDDPIFLRSDEFSIDELSLAMRVGCGVLKSDCEVKDGVLEIPQPHIMFDDNDLVDTLVCMLDWKEEDYWNDNNEV
jgi:hypothetical protein